MRTFMYIYLMWVPVIVRTSHRRSIMECNQELGTALALALSKTAISFVDRSPLTVGSLKGLKGLEE